MFLYCFDIVSASLRPAFSHWIVAFPLILVCVAVTVTLQNSQLQIQGTIEGTIEGITQSLGEPVDSTEILLRMTIYVAVPPPRLSKGIKVDYA